VSSSPKPDQSEGNKTEEVVCRDAEGNSRERETDGNTLEESEDMENVINVHDKGTQEDMIEELNAKLEESRKAFKELKEESQTNERILTEELDIMRSELRELCANNSKFLSQAEYNEERFKFLSANIGIYKLQISALEEKNKTYNLIIVKHEQTIMHLKDEMLVAQDKLYKTEQSLENSEGTKRKHWMSP
jgi:nucleoprotein TPR